MSVRGSSKAKLATEHGSDELVLRTTSKYTFSPFQSLVEHRHDCQACRFTQKCGKWHAIGFQFSATSPFQILLLFGSTQAFFSSFSFVRVCCYRFCQPPQQLDFNLAPQHLPTILFQKTQPEQIH
jgi:hypothetical protein